MRILVIGAGTVGNQLAARLSEENHDVVVVDQDYNKLRTLDEYYDLQTVVGDGTSIEILRKANVSSADLVIAVTNHDASNILICQLASRLDEKGKAYRLARIRNSGCFDDHSVFSPEEAGIDRVIYPEELAAEKIYSLLQRPYADQVFQFLSGGIEVVALTLSFDHFLVGCTMSNLPRTTDLPYRIVALSKKSGDSLIPVNWRQKLEPGDRIYLAAATKDLVQIVESMKFDVTPLRKIFVHGGTNIGFNVARRLEKTDIQVRIVEPSRRVTKQLAYELQNALVLHGEGTDAKLLDGEGLQGSDLFVSVTNDENANLLSCLLAKKMGVKKTIALVAKPDYVPLVTQLNVDSIISQRLMTVNRIMHFVRRGTVMQVEEMVEGQIQALEFRVTAQTAVTDVTLASDEFRRAFPADTILGGMIREEEIIIPDGSASLQAGDRVVVFCTAEKVPELEKFFALGDSLASSGRNVSTGMSLF